MLSIVLSGLYVVICFLLLVVVLLQQGKGGDIASAFGGSGSDISVQGNPPPDLYDVEDMHAAAAGLQ